MMRIFLYGFLECSKMMFTQFDSEIYNLYHKTSILECANLKFGTIQE